MPTIGVAMLAIFLAGFILDLQHSHAAKPAAAPAPAMKPTPLGLRVTSTPQQIQLFWDHDSNAIQNAEKGTIRISDGDASEAIPFDSRQLQDGALVYKPLTNDVSVRMEVDERDGQRVAESVRAVAIP